MLLKTGTILLVAVKMLVFASDILNSRGGNFVQYTKYLNKRIVDMSLAVTNNATFQAQNLVMCTVKCNLNSMCGMVMYNQQARECTMFTNQTVIVDLQPSVNTNVYSKAKIRSCAHPDFYADMMEMKCKAKKTGGLSCEEDEQCTIGLECANYTCQCTSSDKK